MTATLPRQLNRTDARLDAAPGTAPRTDRPTTEPAAIPALLIDHVTKRFLVGRHKRPVIAIHDVSMRLARGEIYGVLGANGSGKSRSSAWSARC